MSVVNGYVCINCADEAKAKRGIDPSKTALEVQQEAQRAATPLGVNTPRPGAATGGRLNLYG